ncbi:MAG TPA: hypothetical protein VGK44_13480 [Casimicrobiaceae bacterium]|jgi:hypothetical protein
MCYGYSSWFSIGRAKEQRKMQEQIDALNKQPAPQPSVAQSKEPAKPVEAREKVPA